MRTCAIVNPTGEGGRGPRLLSRLLDVTSALTVHWTTGPGAATSLTRSALHDGCTRVVAVGGDETLHEVVNGIFENRSPSRPSTVLCLSHVCRVRIRK